MCGYVVHLSTLRRDSIMTGRSRSTTGGSTDTVKGHLDSELVSESYRRRNWKGIALAILVICATVAIIVTTILFTSIAGSSSRIDGTLSLDDTISGRYLPYTFNGSFLSEREIGFLDEYSNYILLNFDNLSHSILLSNETVGNYSVSQYLLSPTKEYFLLSYDKNRLFRHTFTARFKLYNFATKEMTDLNSDVGDDLLQYAAWGPTGTQIVYVYENNIYYMNSVKDPPKKVTSDGVDDVIFNGIPDWVYEEEVLSASNAIWWSPNGTRLCFAQFNDTEVDTQKYMWYGSYKDIEHLYPQVKTIHYPKPGRKNPTTTLYVVDLVNPEKKVALVPPDNIRGDYYFTTLAWLDPERLLVVWVPRSQSNASFSICAASNSWKCVVHTLIQSDGWVSFYDGIVTTDRDYYIKLPKDHNFEHLVKISLNDSTQTFLTHGNFQVAEIKGVFDGRVYYMRTSEKHPNVRHFASVDISGNGTETCHTCDYGANCTFSAITIGLQGKYYVWICVGPEVPFSTVLTLSDHSHVLTWTTNEELKKRLIGQVLPQEKMLRVPIAGGYEAIVKLRLPADFNEKKRYPLLVSVYGGPDSQANTDVFKIDWGTFVSTVKKYIYASIDGRGGSLRGDKLLFEIYKRLGTVEIEDQIAVAKYLAKHTTYVDPDRMGIWGWSYGGYASSLALATGNNTFKCAAAVAPVTSWYYYDTAYTERFMLEPKDNKESYNTSSVLWRAKNFKGKKFLLLHGTADDNVHIQQSMMLIEALSEEGVLFNTHLYPDQDHSISNYLSNLYHTLQDFFDQCFQ